MKILVTGGSGFLGSHVLPALLEEGHSVVATATPGHRLLQEAEHARLAFLPFDLTAMPERPFEYFGKPDALIHLAWSNVHDIYSMDQIECNFSQSLAFIKAMVESGLTNVTVAGTCFEYGLQTGLITEETPLKPVTTYGKAKVFLYESLLSLQRFSPFDLKWIRYFYLYGPGQASKSLLPQLQKALNEDTPFRMSKGDQIRDFISTQEGAAITAKICALNKNIGAVNCCTGRAVSVRDFVENYMNEQGKSVPLERDAYDYPAHEPLAFWGDNTKLTSLLPK